MKRREQLEKQAKALDMDLNYEQKVLIPNIFECGETEWIKSMKNGIGSSSAAVALGRSQYKTPSEIVLEKVTGKGLPMDDDPVTQYRLDSGHQQEAAILKWYANTIGYEIALVDPENPSTSEVKDVSEITEEEWAAWEGKGVVCVDHARYAHPLYPWIFTDPDGICYPPNRAKKYCIECKTGDSREFAFKWKTGIYPDGKVGNPGYVCQARHHMAVLNVDRCDVVAACDFNAANIVVVTIYRDMEEEKKLIEGETKIWKSVEAGEIPEFSSLSDDSYSNVATMLSPDRLSEEEYELSEEYRDTIEEIFKLQGEKKDLQARIKALDERVNALNVSIIPAMEGHAHATMPSCFEGKTIYLELGNVSRKTFNKDKLKLENPEIFYLYEEVKELPEKKLSIKEKKTVKKKKNT